MFNRIKMLSFLLIIYFTVSKCEFVWMGIYRVLVGKPERKRSLGRPRRRWQNNVKIELPEFE